MSSAKKIAAYGTWTSPISSEEVSGSSLYFKELHVNPQNGDIYLLEGRPAEKGRSVIVRIDGTKSVDLLPSEYSVGTRIHEYGGAAATVCPDGSLIFTDANISGVYKLSPSGSVEEIIKGDGENKLRFGDFHANPTDPKWILAVQEEHGKEVLNTIVAINAETKTIHAVASGYDFYSNCRFSHDGKHICMTRWNHPDMPWTGNEAVVYDWENGAVSNETYIAGKARTESICQPRWHLDGSLLFAGDRTGFWQMYRFDLNTSKTEYLRLDGLEQADIGSPEFCIGNYTYESLDKNQLAIVFTKNAIDGIALYDLTTKSFVELPLELVEMQRNGIRRVSDTEFALIAVAVDSPKSLYLVDVTKPSDKELLRASADIDVPASIFSKAETITFPRTHGQELGTSSYAMYCPPYNPDFEAPAQSKPPLIVWIHGGPTSRAGAGLDMQGLQATQYFTSRGYAFVSTNYAGSTGYGRAYRDSLNFSWGIKDVEDSISCIDYLASKGLVDGDKVGIAGQSSGGYTVLQAMCTYPKVFAAGCSLFGIGNLKTICEDTHKFESHYGFALLFPPEATEEEQEKVFYDRSPCFHCDKIERPLVLLQGDQDEVVPIGQAEEMEKVLKAKGADVKLVVFKGEGHGWAVKESVKRTIEEMEALWKRTLLLNVVVAKR